MALCVAGLHAVGFGTTNFQVIFTQLSGSHSSHKYVIFLALLVTVQYHKAFLHYF